MKYLGLLVLLGFVGVAVFGVFGMHRGDMPGHEAAASGDCLAVAVQGVNCPPNGGLIGFLNFHLNALKSFSTATFDTDLLASLLILALLTAVIGWGALFGSLASPPFNFAYSRSSGPELFNPPARQRFLRWLALHENSPAFYSGTLT